MLIIKLGEEVIKNHYSKSIY